MPMDIPGLFLVYIESLKKTQTNKHTRKNQLADYEGKGSGGITQMHLTSYK